MDAFGHVNNVTFLRYLEEARMDFAAKRDLKSRGGGKAGVAVVAKHSISYLRPLLYRSEPVTVEMWLSALDERDFTLAYEIKDAPGEPGPDNTIYVRAETVMVPYDLSVSRKRPLSPDEHLVYSDYLEQQLVTV